MQTVTIPLNILLAANVIAIAAAKLERDALASVHVRPTGEKNDKDACSVDVVSSDGRRLIVLHSMATFSGEPFAFTVTAGMIAQVSKQFKKSARVNPATFEVDGERVSFKEGNFHYSALYEYKFPNYEQVIPKHPKGSTSGVMTFDAELMSGFSTARSLLRDDGKNGVTIQQVTDEKGPIIVGIHGVNGFGILMPLWDDDEPNPFKRLPNP